MSRENFFSLLGLSLDPPESDLVVIETAIRKKQALWSRLRNHPTKGIQAQKFIGLIPEIRRIMTDQELRQTEAEAARKILRQKEADRFRRLDRQIAVYLNKGHITAAEADRLAKAHGVSPDLVQGRVPENPSGTAKGIDRDIALCTRKGFITAAEIKYLSKKHRLPGVKLQQRIKCPVRPDETRLTPGRMLEKSIASHIETNLKVVGKASLYDFLGLEAAAPLDQLQERASRKEAQCLKNARKDGVTTASAILAGQCKTVFREETSRRAYDASLVHARLGELNADIEMAQADGRLRAEYVSVLVQTAMEFGMGFGEARKYIEDYCRQHHWSVTREKKPLDRKWLAAGLVLLILAGSAAGWFITRYAAARRVETAYQAVTRQTQAQPDPARQIGLLQSFLEAHPQSRYQARVEDQIRQLEERRVRTAYAEIQAKAGDFMTAGDFEKALSLYASFLKTHPRSPFSAGARQQMASIDKALEEKFFQSITEPGAVDIFQRVAAGSGYLARFPAGRHREAVLGLIAKSRPALEKEIEQRLLRHEAQEEWSECLELVEFYLRHYPADEKTQAFAGLSEVYRQWREEKRIFAELMQISSRPGQDVLSARRVFDEYLAAHPEMSDFLRQKISRQIAVLSQQETDARFQAVRENVAARLAAHEGRFVLSGQWGVVDQKTGLMWSIVDSFDQLQRLIDYDAALQYAENMDTGGYTDWRMPTMAELGGLYQENSPFPATGQGYWSSDRYKKYEGRWIFLVDTLIPTGKGSWEKRQQYAWDLGAMRAVRFFGRKQVDIERIAPTFKKGTPTEPRGE